MLTTTFLDIFCAVFSLHDWLYVIWLHFIIWDIKYTFKAYVSWGTSGGPLVKNPHFIGGGIGSLPGPGA